MGNKAFQNALFRNTPFANGRFPNCDYSRLWAKSCKKNKQKSETQTLIFKYLVTNLLANLFASKTKRPLRPWYYTMYMRWG